MRRYAGIRDLGSRLSYANVMATLAVFIALGGTAYAVSQLPANSVGAKQIKTNGVGAPEIKAGAVGASEVADGSLLGDDFAAGQLPAGPQGLQGSPGQPGQDGSPGPTYGITQGKLDPNYPPDSLFPISLANPVIDTPSAGRLLVMASIHDLDVDCTAGNAVVGLYLDDVPVPGTGRLLFDVVPEPVDMFGVTGVVAAGPHQLELGVDCEGGDVGTTGTGDDRTAGAVLLGQ